MNLDSSFDNEFTSLKDLNWTPWVGENYKKSKVLIVAESHYEDDEEWLSEPDATRKMVNNQGLNSHNPFYKNRNIFNGIESTLLNRELSTLDERSKLWKNVAYFNLIQRLLPSSKEKPNEADFDQGWTNFLDVVSIIKPTVCIKYGVLKFGRLGTLLADPKSEWKRDNIDEFNSKPFNCVNLSKDDNKLRIIATYHPAYMGFNFQESASYIKKYFPAVDSLFL